MAKPKKFGEVQSLVNNAQNKDYFSTKYGLKAKAGGADGLVIGQEIYCLPLVKDGIYEFATHAVKPVEGKGGFKNSKYTAYIKCAGYNEETGERDTDCPCCRLAQQEWDKYVQSGKKYETKISFESSRFFMPVLLLGNESGSKTASNIPISKLTMSGRDYSYLEFSKKGFNDMLEMFKNDLINNGRMEYGLEGADLQNELMNQMTKHILKISINKPDGFGKHKKVYSFISFDNKNIGAETGSYKNITEGLAKAPKLQNEVQEYLTLFGEEIESVLVPWTEADLENYVKGITSVNNENATQAKEAGVVPAKQAETPAKEEQIVIEEDEDMFTADDADDDLCAEEDISDITLEKTPVAVGAGISDDDMSFDMDNEDDFFGGLDNDEE